MTGLANFANGARLAALGLVSTIIADTSMAAASLPSAPAGGLLGRHCRTNGSSLCRFGGERVRRGEQEEYQRSAGGEHGGHECDHASSDKGLG